MNEYAHLDLFSGLGCWAVAAQANGVRTIAFCEREEWLAVGLERIWQVPCHRAIETFPAKEYAGRVWLLTGSPPCQPASLAGKRRGKADDRWLWDETVDVCKVVQPAWFVFENPPGIDGVGLDGIISDLEGLGYEVATLRIPACAVDSAQDRDRFWIVGNRQDRGGRECESRPRPEGRAFASWPAQSSPLADGQGQRRQAEPPEGFPWPFHTGSHEAGILANSQEPIRGTGLCGGQPGQDGDGVTPDSPWQDYQWIEFNDALYRCPVNLYRMADGVAAGIPRKFRSRLVSALGNAIHWQVAANIIGAIKTASLTP